MLRFILITVSMCAALNISWAQHGKQDSLMQPLDCFLEAERYKLTEDYNKAIEYYQRTLVLAPDYDPALFEMGQISLMQGDYGQALSWLEKAYTIDPDNKWYAEYLGDLYKMTGNIAKAIQIYENQLSNEPQNTDYLQELSRLYLQEGNTKKALLCIEKQEAIDGLSETIALQKRELLLAQGKHKEAIELIKALYQQHPNEAKYCNMIAEMYMKNKQAEAALQWYKKVALLQPDDPYINITLADYYKKKQVPDSVFHYLSIGCANPSLSLSAKVQALSTLIDDAPSIANKANTHKAIKLAKILVETHPKQGVSHAIYGAMLFSDSLFAEAKPELAIAISKDSSNYRLWDQMLLTLGNLEEYDEVVNYSHRAILNFPNMVFPYYMNALANFLLGNMGEAIKTSQVGVQFSPSNQLSEQFYMITGDAYHALNKNDSAFLAYDKALEINPNNPLVLNNYAYYLTLENKALGKAERMSAQAIAADPNPNNLDTYAWVLFCLKKYTQAEEYIEKVLKQDKTPSSEVFAHAGDIFFHTGKSQKAIKYWQKALELSPADKLLQDKVSSGQYQPNKN